MQVNQLGCLQWRSIDWGPGLNKEQRVNWATTLTVLCTMPVQATWPAASGSCCTAFPSEWMILSNCMPNKPSLLWVAFAWRFVAAARQVTKLQRKTGVVVARWVQMLRNPMCALSRDLSFQPQLHNTTVLGSQESMISWPSPFLALAHQLPGTPKLTLIYPHIWHDRMRNWALAAAYGRGRQSLCLFP